jgi:hypothetical protein
MMSLVGNMEMPSAIDRINSMQNVANTLAKRGDRLFMIADLFLEAQRNSHTSVNRWNEAVQDMNDYELGAVRKLFPNEGWPTKYGVPYPNLVALVKWTTKQRLTQLAQLSDIFSSGPGSKIRREACDSDEACMNGDECCC